MQSFKHALSRRNSLERKCYSNWTRLYYRGNTSSKMLPRQDECCPRFYLGKDEVECGNTASMTRGGPAVRTRQMGQYFQAVLYLLSWTFWKSFPKIFPAKHSRKKHIIKRHKHGEKKNSRYPEYRTHKEQRDFLCLGFYGAHNLTAMIVVVTSGKLRFSDPWDFPRNLLFTLKWQDYCRINRETQNVGEDLDKTDPVNCMRYLSLQRSLQILENEWFAYYCKDRWTFFQGSWWSQNIETGPNKTPKLSTIVSTKIHL